jgi:O-antigen/teichoic acid export membrane protein
LLKLIDYLFALVTKIFAALSFVIDKIRLRPFAVDSPEGRASERIRLLSLAAITSGLSKFGSLLIVLASVRWVIGYLGPERFGLWMTITSIISLLSFADLGLSNSVVNLVSDASGKSNFKLVKKIVSNSFFIMTAISLGLGMTFYLLFFFINWSFVLNIKHAISIAETRNSIAIYLAIFLISLPFSVVHRVQVGLQQSWRSNLWTFIGQLLGLAALAIVVNFKGGVPFLIIALAGVPLLISVINHIDYFLRRQPNIRPQFSDFDVLISKSLMQVGALFLFMQLMAVIGNASDNIIISHILGAASVSPYAVIQKLTLILGVSQLFIAPLWPLFGEAMSRGDHFWAKKVLTKALVLSTLFGVLAAAVILFFGEELIAIWAGASMIPDKSLLVGFALYSIVMSLGGAVSVFLNNGEYLQRQALIFIFASIISIMLKIILVTYYKDSSGAIWGTVIGYLFFYIIPGIYLAYSKK